MKMPFVFMDVTSTDLIPVKLTEVI